MDQHGENQGTHIRYYRREQAAELLCICTKTLDQIIRRGEIEALKFGRRVLISHDEVHRFLQKQPRVHGGDQ